MYVCMYQLPTHDAKWFNRNKKILLSLAFYSVVTLTGSGLWTYYTDDPKNLAPRSFKLHEVEFHEANGKSDTLLEELPIF